MQVDRVEFDGTDGRPDSCAEATGRVRPVGSGAVRHRDRWRPLRRLCAVVLVTTVVVVGCSGSSGEETGPTTSFPYLVDPLEPGTGFIQLGENRYPFDGVICAEGAVESDPEGSTRIFGVYANFEVDGVLAAVALTRYHNEIIGEANSVPTLTDTALIQMQGDGEIRGLAAKRFQVVGAKSWQDPQDPTATTELITRDGDRYEARGTFAPVNPDVGSDTTVAGAQAADAVAGQVAARCGDPDTTTTTDPSALPPTSTDAPAD